MVGREVTVIIEISVVIKSGLVIGIHLIKCLRILSQIVHTISSLYLRMNLDTSTVLVSISVISNIYLSDFAERRPGVNPNSAPLAIVIYYLRYRVSNLGPA